MLGASGAATTASRSTSQYSDSLCLSLSGISRSERHTRSEEHTSELQSRQYLVCRLLLEKNNASPVHLLRSPLHPGVSLPLPIRPPPSTPLRSPEPRVLPVSTPPSPLLPLPSTPPSPLIT